MPRLLVVPITSWSLGEIVVLLVILLDRSDLIQAGENKILQIVSQIGWDPVRY